MLGVRRSSLPELEPDGEDWYVNLLWVDRRKCLLATQAETAFSVFVPDVRKAELDPLGPRLADAIVGALNDEGLPRDALGDLDGQAARLGPTASRRTLGIMNDLALHIDYRVGDRGGVRGVDVTALNRQLQRTLHSHQGHYASPLDLIRGQRHRRAAAVDPADAHHGPQDRRPGT